MQLDLLWGFNGSMLSIYSFATFWKFVWPLMWSKNGLWKVGQLLFSHDYWSLASLVRALRLVIAWGFIWYLIFWAYHDICDSEHYFTKYNNVFFFFLFQRFRVLFVPRNRQAKLRHFSEELHQFIHPPHYGQVSFETFAKKYH